jgi:pimeloyl-ACP methyl ester carboxylesterase
MKRFSAIGAIASIIPLLCGAQTAPERTSFALLLRGDTIFDERVSRTPTEMRGEFRDKLRGARISYSGTLDEKGVITRLEARTFRTPTDTLGERATFVVTPDSVTGSLNGAAPTRLRVDGNALLILNPAAAFIEAMVVRARAMGRDTAAFPIYIIGAPQQPMAAEVRRIGPDSVVLTYASVSMRLAVTPTGRIRGGVIPAQGIIIARGTETSPLASAPAVDYSAPANAPYTAEEVVVKTPGGLRLTGTLTLPKNRPRGGAPAVVTITGSGPEDRDENSALIPAYRPFRELADTLGRRGIAVLRLDDRGVNGSDGGTNSATSEDFANDIRAGVAYLRTRSEIDRRRIGLVGHSEGGIIAPMIAAADTSIRSIVLMAGMASTGREIVMEQNRYVIDSVAHLTGVQRDSVLARAGRAVDSAARVPGWQGFFLNYDPKPTASRVRARVLILQGETDRQVPPAEAERLGAAFRGGVAPSVSVHMFPLTNHLFVEDSSGAFADATGRLRYPMLPSLHVRKDVLGAIADWLAKNL